MALDEVLATIAGALTDAETGLAAKTAALATAKGYADGYLRTDFAWDAWTLADVLHPAGQPRVAVAPASASVNQLAFVGTARDAQHQLRISFETFAADPALIQDTVLTVSEALLEVLDGIEAYSRSTGGTIAMLVDPITFTFGTFDGPATAAGFTALVTVLERSTR